MNILFLTESEISPLQGGTERITHTISQELIKRGNKCFLAYDCPCTLSPTTSFSGKIKYSKGREREQIEHFIVENNIQYIISNLVGIEHKRRLLPLMYDITRKSSAKIISCFHAMPGEEIAGNSVSSSIYRIFHKGSIKSCLKDIALYITPSKLTKRLFKKHLENRYRLLYDNSDKLVLLSEKFYPDFSSFGNLKIDGKFYAIPNALSFDEFATDEEISAKVKEVMILSRMDEKSKRISMALKIWSIVNQSGKYDDWKLTIIGGGTDIDYFKRIAKRLKLKNISFEGRQENSIPYYKRSSIFLMTSRYEGWGITLTEAQQMGVIPIAFGSYASITDIITNKDNGIIIPNNHIHEFSTALMNLMDHEQTRHIMAKKCVESSKRYNKDNVIKLWCELLQNTSTN